jgi:hypothetical protein
MTTLRRGSPLRMRGCPRPWVTTASCAPQMSSIMTMQGGRTSFYGEGAGPPQGARG